MSLKSMVAAVLVISITNAAPKHVDVVEAAPTPEISFPTWNPDDYKEATKTWKAVGRKIASVGKSTEAFNKDLMAPWHAIEKDNGEGLSSLLVNSYKSYDKYSPEVKYFLNHMHPMIPLKGIVWRLRKLFEAGGEFGGLGNKSTHMSAVQFVRKTATGLSAAFPTDQTSAMIAYFTKPGVGMSEDDQFKSIAEFQDFLVVVYVPYLVKSAERIKALVNITEPFVWDNSMYYKGAKFENGFNRYVGHGLAEMHIAIATLNEAAHDALVFSAYNQNDLIRVAGALGRKFGIDIVNSSDWNEMGLTDIERTSVIKGYTAKGFLKLRTFASITNSKYKKYINDYVVIKGSNKELGQTLISRGYEFKKISVNNFNSAYISLNGKAPNASMAINPGLYQSEIQNRLNIGVGKMVEAIAGPTDFTDPITGKAVRLDVPNFYSNPPESLEELMATNKPEKRKSEPFVESKGKKLYYRDYFAGNATEWNNKAWGKYVTSAVGKDAGYMMEAKRSLHFALGGTPVFGIVDIFIK